MRSLLSALAAAGLAVAPPSQAQAPDPTQQWALPEGGLLNGSKAEIENAPCCTTNRGAPVRNSDAAVLARLPNLAAREGNTLRLNLDGDRALRLTDCDPQASCDPDDTRIHRLVARWPNQHLYVVSVALYEEQVAYLVSESDGRALVVTAPPVLSPSGRQAIALVSNLMAGIDLEVIDLGRDPPTVAKITTMPGCPGANEASMLRPKPVWIDESHVRFEGVSPQSGDNPHTKQLLRITNGKVAWEC